MSAGEGVVFTFKRCWEWTDAMELSVGAECLTSSGQNLMSVCLMAYIPDDAVFRSIVHVV